MFVGVCLVFTFTYMKSKAYAQFVLIMLRTIVEETFAVAAVGRTPKGINQEAFGRLGSNMQSCYLLAMASIRSWQKW